jgi:hypothetical protein
MTTATAVGVIHALHKWSEPNALGVYPFLPHDIVQSITELALIHHREVWFDKRNWERDMEIYALRASPKARFFCPKETPGRLSTPIFAYARQDALLWNIYTETWVRNATLLSYRNEWQFPHHDGGFMILSDHLIDTNNSICRWMHYYKQGERNCLTTPHKHFHRAFLMVEFNDDIYAD